MPLNDAHVHDAVINTFLYRRMLLIEWRAHFPQTQYSRRRYIEILDWFVDDPEHPYSIHRIAKAGLALDKRIGEWFGPSTVAHAFQ